MLGNSSASVFTVNDTADAWQDATFVLLPGASAERVGHLQLEKRGQQYWWRRKNFDLPRRSVFFDTRHT